MGCPGLQLELKGKKNLFKILTVLAIVAVFAQRTKAEIAAARECDTRATILARIVVANGNFTRGPHEAGRTFAVPFILDAISVGVRQCDNIIFTVIGGVFHAGGPIATRIGEACQRAALLNVECIKGVTGKKVERKS